VTAAFGDAVPVLKPVSACQTCPFAIRVIRAAAVDADGLLRLGCCRQTSQQESRHDSTKLAHTSSSKDRFELSRIVCDRSGRGGDSEKARFNNTANLDFMEAKQLLV